MEFNFREWNVPLIQEPNELMKRLKELGIKGKKIKSIRCVGLCYNLSEDMIEDHAYGYYEKEKIENYEELSNYENILPDTPFTRYVEIDEPIIIYFDNGDRLEIDFSEASNVKIGKNTLPEDIDFLLNGPNADMNIVFSNCIGGTIKGFEVIMSDELYSDYTGSLGTKEPGIQSSYILQFRILLEEGAYMEFNNFYDYGEVTVYQYGKSEVLWKDLKNGIKNW